MGKFYDLKNEPVSIKLGSYRGFGFLLGIPIKGHVTAARAGHASNVEFVKKIKKEYAKELNQLWSRK